MTRLPSSKKVVDILIKNGFLFVSQRGSHQKYTNGKQSVIVPAPRKEIPKGTLKSISRQSGINISEFLNQ
jgi:predicted RNA binding protein YcfA (HicA-like mRNA interferase family)